MIADLAGLRILKGGLKHGIGAHPERVFQSQVRGKRGQALPESSDTFRTRNRGAAMKNPLVGTGPVELQPGLDDVDRLKTACLHYPSR